MGLISHLGCLNHHLDSKLFDQPQNQQMKLLHLDLILIYNLQDQYHPPDPSLVYHLQLVRRHQRNPFAVTDLYLADHLLGFMHLG